MTILYFHLRSKKSNKMFYKIKIEKYYIYIHLNKNSTPRGGSNLGERLLKERVWRTSQFWLVNNTSIEGLNQYQQPS